MKPIDAYDEEDFKHARELYAKTNDTFDRTLIFHVGTGAGLYSELGGMLEAMMWCYLNKVRFTLYADDANFSGENGWTEFFEEFCPMNHNPLNRFGNRRFNGRFRYVRKFKHIPFVDLPQIILKIYGWGGGYTLNARHFQGSYIQRVQGTLCKVG